MLEHSEDEDDYHQNVRDHILSEQHAHLEWKGLAANQTVQRQSKFYAIVLIFPTALLNLLTLVVFTLPTDTTERESFSLTLILTYFVLILIIVDSIPPTGNQIPKLGLYVIMCCVIVVITFWMSLLLIELHEHKRIKGRKMSRKLFWMLQKCCCFDRYYSEYQKASHRKYKPSKSNDKNDSENLGLDEEKEDFKWKLFANVLNYVFFALTVIAHIMLPCLIFAMDSNA